MTGWLPLSPAKGKESLKEKDKAAAVEHLKALTSKYDFQKEKAAELLQELE